MGTAPRLFLPVRLSALAVLALCALALPAAAQDDPDNEIRIGILAHRGWSGVERYWTPLETYLGDGLHTPVRLVPVTLASAGPLIENGALQFLITNPGHYVALEKSHPLSVIATLRRRLSDGSFRSEFGSTVFAPADTRAATLKDTAGLRVSAVDPRAFGGFQLAWHEFAAQGIDPFRDFAQLDFVGFPQDRIVDEVLSGKADIGIVRSGLIETLAAEGRLDPARLKVLNANASFTYPEALSTRLYPEWPFLALAGTPPDLRDRVALLLLRTQDADLRQAAGLRDGWGAPLSYHTVRDLDAAYSDAARATTRRTGAAWRLPVAAGAALLLAAAVAALFLHRRRSTPPRQDRGAMPAAAGPGDAPPVQLTHRETEILALVAEGLSSKQIARRLDISPKTVEFHRSNLLRKHGARSAVELVRKTASMAAKPES